MEALAPLRAHPLAGMMLAMTAFAGVVAALPLASRAAALGPESSRKLLHVAAGLLTLPFPLLFADPWPVYLLTAATALLILAVETIPGCRARVGRLIAGVERSTLGEFYFPLSVAIVFRLAHGKPEILFIVPMLVLTIADAAGALAGGRPGVRRYAGGRKSVEGSAAFAAAALVCASAGLLVWTDGRILESVLAGATLALALTLVEGCAPRGLDNLFIPLAGYFVLEAILPLGAGDLLPRLLVISGLLVLVAICRRPTAAGDEVLLASAFGCYVAWAVPGWNWVALGLMTFIGFQAVYPEGPRRTTRLAAPEAAKRS